MLKAGSRLVDLEVGLCEGDIKLIPDKSCDLGALDMEGVLTSIADFLRSNPHEVIMVRAQLLNHGHFHQDSSLAKLDSTIQKFPGWTDDKIYRYPGTWWPWPTLRELIEADTRVLFFPYTVDHTNLLN